MTLYPKSKVYNKLKNYIFTFLCLQNLIQWCSKVSTMLKLQLNIFENLTRRIQSKRKVNTSDAAKIIAKIFKVGICAKEKHIFHDISFLLTF